MDTEKGGGSVEDMIAKIVEMDKKARELNDKAQKTKVDYEHQIILKKEKIKTDYLERAKKRIAINQQTAQKRADEKLKRNHEKNDAISERLEAAYAENGNAWVERIVQNVLEMQ